MAHPVLVLAAVALELLLWGGDGRVRFFGAPPLAWVVVLVLEALVVLVLLTRGQSLRRAYLFVWLLTLALAVGFPGIEPFVGLLIVLYRLARTRPRRQAWPYAAATAVPWVVNVANAVTSVGMGALAAGIDVLLWGVITVLVWTAARYGWGMEQLAAEREAAAVQRQQLAVQDERLRLARELHDVVSHSVSAIILQAAGATNALSPDPAVRSVLSSIETSGTRAMHELRGLLGLLSPAGGRVGGLRLRVDHPDALIDTTRACGIRVDLTQSGSPGPFDDARHVVGYRVLQEGLTNVMRHAGPGSTAAVRVDWVPSGLVIEVESSTDTPVSAPVGGSSGQGLDGLRRRVAEVHGELESEVGDVPGRYLLRARIPYAGQGG